MKVIVYEENGIVCVCNPVEQEENFIQWVKEKDCPTNADIIEENRLPIGIEAICFEAWDLNVENNQPSIIVNLSKAKDYTLKIFNQKVIENTKNRQLNILSGISNVMSDEEYITLVNNKREEINSSINLEELVVLLNYEF